MTIVTDQFGIKFLDSADRLHRPQRPVLFNLTAVDNVEGIVTYTTAVEHGFLPGEPVVVNGIDYGGNVTVISVPTPTTFTAESQTEGPATEDSTVYSINQYGPALLVTTGRFFQGNHQYEVGDIVFSRNAGGFIEHVVTVAGISDSSEPEFDLYSTEGEVESGTVTFLGREYTGDAFWYEHGKQSRCTSGKIS